MDDDLYIMLDGLIESKPGHREGAGKSVNLLAQRGDLWARLHRREEILEHFAGGQLDLGAQQRYEDISVALMRSAVVALSGYRIHKAIHRCALLHPLIYEWSLTLPASTTDCRSMV